MPIQKNFIKYLLSNDDGITFLLQTFYLFDLKYTIFIENLLIKKIPFLQI